MIQEPFEGIISKKINRKFSTPLAQFFAKYNIFTPNQVSILAFSIAVFSVILYSFEYLLFAGIMVQLIAVLDGVDGQLARITKKTSKYGGFLDAILDKYGEMVIVFGMTYYLYLHNFTISLLFGILAIFGSMMLGYTRGAFKEVIEYKESVLGYLQTTDTRYFIIFLGSIVGTFYPVAILISLIILSIITNLVAILRLRKNFSKFL